MTANPSNHHRYGEVKTRLTIGTAVDFGKLSPNKDITGGDRPKVAKDGRVTVPKRVREHLGIALRWLQENCFGWLAVYLKALTGNATNMFGAPPEIYWHSRQ
jgi:hypothetical protein